ncbi:hydrolase 1, exosortase A system-associated [Neptunomonas japonica]|uniref:Esterase/lipase/thioesterase family protein n=1 Tax=Neptunomonas japonica JAMM 1380 TaxID=1441457 RepID=A0A7R6SUW4_9GAMM|nr:hydrolase 1, exosortase A system-associated [Neptunomonas japonica]BBB28771.1 esterase/lipase/thioesterase family protein [Neptunomonas japonica JAMM 1380]
MTPQFVNGPSGRLFITQHSANAVASSEWIIYLPAFAEEMNKSRSMVRAQAAAFVKAGATVIVPDLFGTGDSEGDFGDANWGVWKQDIRYLVLSARQQGARKITLWGLRAGALMALDLMDEGLDGVSELILWQPVHSGEQMLTQFLRLRMAAGMMTGEQETVAQLRERLSAGEKLEVAGYDVAPSMLSQLDQVSLKKMALKQPLKINWLEIVASEGRALLPVSQKLITLWQSQDIEIYSKAVVGEPFWTTQEITLAPNLIDETVQLISPSLTSGISSAELPASRLPDSDLVVPEYKLQGAVQALDSEQPFVFSCEGEELVAVLHLPKTPEKAGGIGVLVIVGGPQYRVGSHRQFLHLARHLAKENIPVMRFDYRGMGDASGELLGFENVQVDIQNAIDNFMQKVPELEGVVLWGLCDAASAACFYAPSDKRVAGLVILNPWVRSEAGEAKAFLKHYYLQRLFSRQLWSKVLKGNFNISASLASLVSMLKRSSSSEDKSVVESEIACTVEPLKQPSTNLPEKIQSSLKAYQGPVQYIMSGNDLTAAEFDDAVKGSKSFTRLLKQKRMQREDLKSADHTFSKREWRDKVAAWTVNWIRTL